MIEKTFIVVCVETFRGGVLVYLKPSEPLDLSSSSPLERVLGPSPQSEDAKIARDMVQTIMQEVQKSFPDAQMMPGPSPFVIKLYFTQKEYEELHKPTINDTVKLQLEIQKEGEQT